MKGQTSILLCLVLCLGAALVGKEVRHPDAKGYLRDWLVGGPYPAPLRDGIVHGLDEDYTGVPGGEAALRPWSGMTGQVEFPAVKAKLIAGIGSTNEWGFTETKVQPVTWREMHCIEERPYLFFDGMFTPFDDYVTAYAVCYVVSGRTRSVQIGIGSDDENRVYVNGEKVGELRGSRGITPDTVLYPAVLRRGLNILLVKVVDYTNGFGFCLDLKDPSGAPVTDVDILMENPVRNLAATYGKSTSPDAWDDGLCGWLEMPRQVVREKLKDLPLAVGGIVGRHACVLRILAGEKVIWEKRRELDFVAGRLERFVAEVNSTEMTSGSHRVMLEVDGGRHSLDIPFEVVSGQECQERLEALRKQRQSLQEKLAQDREALRNLEAQYARNTARHTALYGEIEAAFAAQRQSILAAYPGKPFSPEPLRAAPQALRTMMLLNGDCWRIAKGTNPPKDGTAEQWRNVRLPRVSTIAYKLPVFWPVRHADPKQPHSATKVPLPGWENESFDESLIWNAFRVKTDVEIEEEPSGRSYNFLCDNILGGVQVWLNGVHEGDYEGVVGQVRIPLAHVQRGRNILELRYRDIESITNSWDQFNNRRFGIRDNLLIESIPSTTFVENVWVKTSWRKGTLQVMTEVENRAAHPVECELEQSCVLNGSVQYRLPRRRLSLPANGRGTSQASGIWLNPELWGPGGAYGSPTLYQLVTDIYVDGTLRDRHVERFGFREFWISGCDFYLNGKHILLQGDGGNDNLDTRKFLEVFLPVYRRENINIFRNHDSAFWSPEYLKCCDRMGMLAYVNMYPMLFVRGYHTPDKFLPLGEWLRHPLHRFNLNNYRAWHRLFRNHPSVVIVSTDNEIYTQAWDKPEKLRHNERNDALGALYNRFVKSLDPDLVLTRDGDIGTWGLPDRQQDIPSCDTANYHYPDFGWQELICNWPVRYGFRPAIWGETLYYSYGAWDKYCGPLPSKVLQKANTVRFQVRLNREWCVPGVIYVGPSSDGYSVADDSGQGNPFGIRLSEHNAGSVRNFPGYPWTKIQWPAASGLGPHDEYKNIDIMTACNNNKNWFDERFPSHVRNAVNDAYRDNLIPQPPLVPAPDAECIVELGPQGAGAFVYVESVEDGLFRHAVKADRAGRAWLNVPRAGTYRVRSQGLVRTVVIPGKERYQSRPGFDRILRVTLPGKEAQE
ncbi:MAG: hypothetical protein IJJ26_11365 [Victivallales bacterium]|nr:hypothetical protein [Victivallales bacterium]